MKAPLFIRPLSKDERSQVRAGLRSSDAFVLRRCQILLASNRGERTAVIAKQLGCHKQTVLTVIHGFNANGLAVLQEGSSRPHRLRTTFSEEGLFRLQDLLHRSCQGRCTREPVENWPPRENELQRTIVG